MPTLEWTEREIHTAIHALRLAAERFNEHAVTMRGAGMANLAEEFERQTVDSRQLADKLEEAA